MPKATKLVGRPTGIPAQAAQESTVLFATTLSSRRPVTCLFLPLATEIKQGRDVVVPPSRAGMSIKVLRKHLLNEVFGAECLASDQP